MDEQDRKRYCLYARKSSESDERQAMSIGGQIKEMLAQAKKLKLEVVETIEESHSAKESGQRPAFNNLLTGIAQGAYNCILTWAPDRLSRNAGDLGRIVDFMDQGKLVEIKTHSQTFSNNPNEKFLLMILCSQAKLENDNRGINVKRGLRNKCEIGIRPGVAPIGYKNVLTANRISTVVLDEKRAPVIKAMFEKVGNQGYSGRMVKKWLDEIEFRTKNDCAMPLSKVYKVLQNTFYYGKFKYGGKWYKGIHEKLVTEKLFEKVQIQLQVAPRQWNKQMFPFKKICVCGGCGGNITAEMKHRRTKAGKVNTHIYYHCNRIKKYDCGEPYITERELIKQIIRLLPQLKLNVKYLMDEMGQEVKRLQHLKATLDGKFVASENLNMKKDSSGIIELGGKREMVEEYLLHVLRYGSPEERLKIMKGVKSKLMLRDRELRVSL